MENLFKRIAYAVLAASFWFWLILLAMSGQV
jgi:hypothetical protein